MKKIIIFILIAISINAQSWNDAVEDIGINDVTKLSSFTTNNARSRLLVKTLTDQIIYHSINKNGVPTNSNAIPHQFTSNGNFPNIVGTESGSKIYATYLEGNYIKTQYSTNNGANWTQLPSIYATSVESIDVLYFDEVVHVVWVSGNGVYYKRYNSANQPGEYMQVSSVGHRPSVTALGNYLYVSYNSHNTGSVALNYGTKVKIRRKDLANNTWNTPEQISFSTGYTGSRVETVFATDNYLYLYYYGCTYISSPTDFRLKKKDLSTNGRRLCLVARNKSPKEFVKGYWV